MTELSEENVETPESTEAVTERPEWLPDKFETPEALAKSYREAERRLTELSQQTKTYEQLLTDQQAQFEAQQEQSRQAQYDPDDQEAAFQERLGTAGLQTVVGIARDIARMEYDQRMQEFQKQQFQPVLDAQTKYAVEFVERELTAKYDDWDSYKEKVSELIKERPYLVPPDLSDPTAVAQSLDAAYKMVKADALISGTAPAQPSNEDLMRTMKLNAQSASGGGGRPESPDESAQRWSEIINAPSQSARSILGG